MYVEHVKERCHEDGDCWIWRLACSSNGTPKITISENAGRKQYAVRRLLASEMGLNIEGKFVTNKCGNPRCVFPDHILVLTRSAMDKLVAKRTGHPYKLERRKKISDVRRKQSAKLTPEMVAEIRASDKTLRELGAEYGVAAGTVGAIKRYEKWQEYSSPFNGLGAR